MNLPFELGIDYGCRLAGRPTLKKKRLLVLEKDQYEFQRAISDLSGIDIKSHGNEPERVVRAVRNWFVETVGVHDAPSASRLWDRFTLGFVPEFYRSRAAQGFSGADLNMMPVPEYTDAIRQWLAPERAPARKPSATGG